MARVSVQGGECRGELAVLEGPGGTGALTRRLSACFRAPGCPTRATHMFMSANWQQAACGRQGGDETRREKDCSNTSYWPCPRVLPTTDASQPVGSTPPFEPCVRLHTRWRHGRRGSARGQSGLGAAFPSRPSGEGPWPAVPQSAVCEMHSRQDAPASRRLLLRGTAELCGKTLSPPPQRDEQTASWTREYGPTAWPPAHRRRHGAVAAMPLGFR